MGKVFGWKTKEETLGIRRLKSYQIISKLFLMLLCSETVKPWSSLVVEDEACIGATTAHALHSSINI